MKEGGVTCFVNPRKKSLPRPLFSTEKQIAMLIKGSTMLFRDKHRCLFLFCLLFTPGPPCQSPSPELLSAVIDIFKTAAAANGQPD